MEHLRLFLIIAAQGFDSTQAFPIQLSGSLAETENSDYVLLVSLFCFFFRANEYYESSPHLGPECN